MALASFQGYLFLIGISTVLILFIMIHFHLWVMASIIIHFMDNGRAITVIPRKNAIGVIVEFHFQMSLIVVLLNSFLQKNGQNMVGKII